jgi:hypothetical protein
VHKSPSSHGAVLGTCVHTPDPLQTSSVHGFTSSKHGRPAVSVPMQAPCWHVSFAVQGLESSHEPPVCGVPMQKPAAHVSPVVHAFRSSHGSLFGVEMHWPVALHASVVQGFESALHGVPGSAAPVATQTPSALQ